MPENCIFYLKGTRDIIKKYYEPKPRFIQGVQKCRATDNTLTNRKVYNGANNAVISYRKKADISNINPKMVSVSFWFKKGSRYSIISRVRIWSWIWSKLWF